MKVHRKFTLFLYLKNSFFKPNFFKPYLFVVQYKISEELVGNINKALQLHEGTQKVHIFH